MRVLLSGGGTGGHIYPALALKNEIAQRNPKARFLYIGSEKGLEKDIVAQSDLPFRSVSVSGFRRKLSWENVKTVIRFIKAVRRSKALIRDFKPDVVVGTGGFVCGPVVYAASRLKVPTMIHEQNVVPGLTNAFLSRYVNCVAVSFSGSVAHFPKNKTVLTGNPRATEVVRADARKGRLSLELPENKKIVLIVGGSRGARPINDAFMEMVTHVANDSQVHYVYVTGEAHYESIVDRLKPRLNEMEALSVYPFLYNMPEVLAATDLIVNRAGASFLAEITALGIPSILIPSPYVTNNHQEKNARWLEEKGAAAVLLENELNGVRLKEQIDRIVRDEAFHAKMQTSSRALGRPDAAKAMGEELMRLMR